MCYFQLCLPMLLCGFMHCWYALFRNTKIHSIKLPYHIVMVTLSHQMSRCLCSNWDQVETNPSFLTDSLDCVGKNSIWPFVEWQHRAARTQFDKSGKWFSHHAHLNQVLVWTLLSFSLPCINYRLYSWQHHFFTVQWLWKRTLLPGHTQQDIHSVWQRLHRSDFLNRLLTLHFGLLWRVLLCLDFTKF